MARWSCREVDAGSWAMRMKGKGRGGLAHVWQFESVLSKLRDSVWQQ